THALHGGQRRAGWSVRRAGALARVRPAQRPHRATHRSRHPGARRMSTQDFVTHPQLAALVEIIDRRMDKFERAQNRMLLVLGSAQVLTLAVLLYHLSRS